MIVCLCNDDAILHCYGDFKEIYLCERPEGYFLECHEGDYDPKYALIINLFLLADDEVICILSDDEVICIC